MSGHTLKTARLKAGWSQTRVAGQLRVTQAYLSLMEAGKRPVPDRIKRAAARVLGLPATALPTTRASTRRRPAAAAVADDLARLGYPGLAYRKKARPTSNPVDLLLDALALDEMDARLAESLPWVLLQFEGLDFDELFRCAKAHDLQNRLGFALSLAREVAEHNAAYKHRWLDLGQMEQRLEKSRLAREDNYGPSDATDRMRAWVRENRSDAAKHWNLLTDLRREHLSYGG